MPRYKAPYVSDEELDRRALAWLRQSGLRHAPNPRNMTAWHFRRAEYLRENGKPPDAQANPRSTSTSGSNSRGPLHPGALPGTSQDGPRRLFQVVSDQPRK